MYTTKNMLKHQPVLKGQRGAQKAKTMKAKYKVRVTEAKV